MNIGSSRIRYHIRKSSKRARRNRKRGAASFINRDKLNQANEKAVAKAMVEVFHKLQNEPKEVQLLALASAFVIMAEAFRFSTSDTYSAVVNLMRDNMTASGRGLQFDAMKYHLETELAQGAA